MNKVKFEKWTKERVSKDLGITRFEYYQLHKGLGHSSTLQTLKALANVWRQETGEQYTVDELRELVK